jgi:adenosylcobinamide-phosphate synthase
VSTLFAPLAATALALEAAFGYPAPLYRVLGHPVTWMGAFLSRLEARLNHGAPAARRAKGALTLALLLTAAALPALVLQRALGGSWGGLLILGLLASSLLAQRSLYEHVKAVADALDEQGLAGGRARVAMIVGRDPAALDEAGVARAAIESLAENFSDGVVAPLFWLVVAGLPGASAYKAANTADSMIGHRNPRYQDFGKAAARFDDLVNLPASRLAALWLALASGRHAGAALKAVRRDAGRHRSPNAGWPEAAMAGALGLQLAGPRVYGGVLVDDAFMGEGRREAGAADIRAALRLYVRACAIQFAVVAVLALFA